MRIFIIIILAVYLLAVNVYGFLLVKNGSEAEEGSCECLKTSKYLLPGALGGALGVYVAMFVYKFRLESLALMAVLPVLIAVTVFAVYMLFARNFFLPVGGEQVVQAFCKRLFR